MVTGTLCMILLAAVLVLVVIYFCNNSKSGQGSNVMGSNLVGEHFDGSQKGGVPGDVQEAGQLAVDSGPVQIQSPPVNQGQPPAHVVGASTQGALSTDSGLKQQRQAGCFPKDQLNPEELLPQDNANVWAKSNPSGEGTLKDRNFLQAGHHIGVNTVGQTLRNANMQLRSEPPNPQVKVSPWLQATIEPDVNRKPMEIGGCA
tara:strand:+ start:1390 stop:1995 length:606 start_codon:yes stop_codon:yes gene_type:complete